MTQVLQLQSVTTDVLRDRHYAYNNSTLVYERSTLLERQSSNGLATYSTDLSNATWTKTGLNTPTNTVTGPDGIANSACTMIEDASTGFHQIIRTTPVFTANTPQSCTRWVKAVGRPYGRLTLESGADVAGVSYDLSAGTVSNFIVGAGTVQRSKITAGANGWFRIHVVCTVNPTSTTASWSMKLANPSGTYSYVGDGVSGIYHYNAQHEVDAACWSSDMPTGAAGFTRSGDVCSFDMSGTAIATPCESTWYLKFIELGTVFVSGSGAFRIFQMGAGASAAQNRFHVYANGSGFYVVDYVSGGTEILKALSVGPTMNDLVEIRAYLSPTGFATIEQSINGAASTSATTATNLALPSSWFNNTLMLGSSNTTGVGAGLIGVQAFKVAVGNQSLATMRTL